MIADDYTAIAAARRKLRDAAAAPRTTCRYVQTIRDFVITTGEDCPSSPRRMWWTACGEPTDWPAPRSIVYYLGDDGFCVTGEDADG